MIKFVEVDKECFWNSLNKMPRDYTSRAVGRTTDSSGLYSEFVTRVGRHVVGKVVPDGVPGLDGKRYFVVNELIE